MIFQVIDIRMAIDYARRRKLLGGQFQSMIFRVIDIQMASDYTSD